MEGPGRHAARDPASGLGRDQNKRPPERRHARHACPCPKRIKRVKTPPEGVVAKLLPYPYGDLALPGAIF